MARSYRRRRSYRRPRASLRRRRRTRRRRVARRQFRRAHGQGQIYYKVKRLIPVAVDGTIPTGTFWRLWGNFNGAPRETGSIAPLIVVKGAGDATTGVAPTQVTGYNCGDVPILDNQLDTVRIAGMKVKWLPAIPAGVTGTGSYLPAVTITDRDGIDQDPIGTSLAGWMEQLSGCNTWNLYRPYKKYFRATKYRMNTNVPSVGDATWETQTEANVPWNITPPSAYETGTMYGGQWHRTNQGARSVTTTSTGGTQIFPLIRGMHWEIIMPIPLGWAGGAEEELIGSFVVTSYLVYKDRR